MPGLGDYGNSANEINMVITATDQASAVLKNVNKETTAFQTNIKNAAKAAGMITAAMTTTYVAVKKLVDGYAAYGTEVRKLSQLNGTSAVETSRLIQLADDYKVSVQDLTMATRKLAGEGKSLTIDVLAEMSDQYLSLGTNAEKSKLLIDQFGRSGLNMVEMMNLGSDAIKKQAAAVNSNLLMTEKQLKATRDYDFALDAFNDTVYASKVALGNYLLPVAMKVIKAGQDGADAWMGFGDQLKKIDSLVVNMEGPRSEQGNWAKFWAVSISDFMQMLNGPLPQAFSSAGNAAEKWRDRVKNAIIDTGDEIASMGDAEQSFLLSTQEMTPKVIAEFYAIQKRVEKVKEMIAKGVSFTIVANYLLRLDSGAPGQSKPDVLKTTPGGGGGDWVRAGPGWEKSLSGAGYREAPNQKASGGHASGLFWTGDSPSGLTPHSELVYAPGGAYVYNASQSRSMTGAPRAFTGGTIPGMSGDTNLSSSTIRQLANEIAGAMARQNG